MSYLYTRQSSIKRSGDPESATIRCLFLNMSNMDNHRVVLIDEKREIELGKFDMDDDHAQCRTSKRRRFVFLVTSVVFAIAAFRVRSALTLNEISL